jgi:hypothetical protein
VESKKLVFFNEFFYDQRGNKIKKKNVSIRSTDNKEHVTYYNYSYNKLNLLLKEEIIDDKVRSHISLTIEYGFFKQDE